MGCLVDIVYDSGIFDIYYELIRILFGLNEILHTCACHLFNFRMESTSCEIATDQDEAIHLIYYYFLLC